VLTVDDVNQSRDELDFWEAIEDRSDQFETVKTAAEDDLTVFYTSGTTGDLKGVRRANECISATSRFSSRGS